MICVDHTPPGSQGFSPILRRNRVKTKYAFGTACCRKNPQTGKREILLVHKKHTYAFVDFVLCLEQYKSDNALQALFDKMTINEKLLISKMNYDTLWESLCTNIPDRPPESPTPAVKQLKSQSIQQMIMNTSIKRNKGSMDISRAQEFKSSTPYKHTIATPEQIESISACRTSTGEHVSVIHNYEEKYILSRVMEHKPIVCHDTWRLNQPEHVIYTGPPPNIRYIESNFKYNSSVWCYEHYLSKKQIFERRFVSKQSIQDLTSLMDGTKVENEIWEIPKGRPAKGELALDCAMREWFEETGCDLKNIEYDLMLNPITSEYTINKQGKEIRYQTSYYIAYALDNNFEPTFRFNKNQAIEVQNISWFSIDKLELPGQNKEHKRRLKELVRQIFKRIKIKRKHNGR
jgi:8-oxo-dGTP pyrophosphatase MutT (NUDIX family)